MHFRFLFEFQHVHSADLSLSVATDVEPGSDLAAVMQAQWQSLQTAHDLTHIPFADVRVYLQAVKGIYVVAKECHKE